MYFKCCIKNCENRRQDAKLHKFSSDERQRNKWLEVINCDKLKSLDPASLSKLQVCSKHFEPRFHTLKSGIKIKAYPTFFSAEEIARGVPLKSYDEDFIEKDHTYARKRHYDHSYCQQPSMHTIKPSSLKHQESIYDDTIEICGSPLSVIFDPPHLIKGMRNNFLTKDIVTEGKVSKWEDISDVYKTDCRHTQSRLLHKLNDEHVVPDKKKMKVKHCVRVFSKTMAAALSYTSAFSHYTDGKPVSSTLRNTAETVSFLDDLFDSVNGSTLSHIGCKGKQLRKAVTSSSLHHQFWRDAKRKIESLKFLDKGKEKSVPTLKIG